MEGNNLKNRYSRTQRRKRKYIKIICFVFLCLFILIIILIAILIYVVKIKGKDESEIIINNTMDLPYTFEEKIESESAEEVLQNDDENGVFAKDTDVLPVDETIIEKDPEMYLYQDMLYDMKILLAKYSDLINIEDMGTTQDNREIWLFRIGSADASNKILIHGGIHGREYITCQLVMKQMVRFLELYRNNDTYKGYTYDELMDDTAIYVIPMVNPDGMSISQLGIEGIQTDSVYLNLGEIAAMDGRNLTDSSYLASWKANARGVDLNRNFDALWEEYEGVGQASSDHYKGTCIGSEVESRILIKLTVQEMFSRTISYHSQGSVVYWYFKQDEPLYSATYSFARRIGEITGYTLDNDYQNLDPAGFKDWCICKMDIPSLTIEVGTGASPVPVSQFDDIWVRNQYVFQETLLDLRENPYKPRDDSMSLISYNDKIGYALSYYL